MAMNYGPQGSYPGPQGPYPGQGGPVQAQGMPPAPKKKGMSTGCIIAIVAVLVFFGSIGGVVLYLVYRVSNNKDVQNIMGAIGDVAAIAAEAQTAPGTAELRAQGCQEALALDAEKMKKLMSTFVDAGSGGGMPPAPTGMEFEKIVVCKAGAFSTPPKCDDLARTYSAAAHLKGQFMLSVQQNNKSVCASIYTAAGASVAPVGPGSGKY